MGGKIEIALSDMKVGLSHILESIAHEQSEMQAKLTSLDTQVQNAIAPLLLSLTNEQIDTRAKLTGLDTQAQKVIAPLLLNLASDQIDMRAKVMSLDTNTQKAIAPLLLSLSQDQIDTRAKLSVTGAIPMPAYNMKAHTALRKDRFGLSGDVASTPFSWAAKKRLQPLVASRSAPQLPPMCSGRGGIKLQ